jgi:hypothetical protein
MGTHIEMGMVPGMGDIKTPGPDSPESPVGGIIVSMLDDGKLVTEFLEIQYNDAFIETFGEEMPSLAEFNSWKEEIEKS